MTPKEPSVSETNLPDGTDSGKGNPTGTDETVATGTISVNFGADGPATDGEAFMWNVVELDALNYKATGGEAGMGVKLKWTQTGAGEKLVLTGSADGQDVVTVKLNGDPVTGEFTYEVTLHKPLYHDKTPVEVGKSNPEDKSLDLTFPFIVKDGDGSISVSERGSLIVSIKDDMPEWDKEDKKHKNAEVTEASGAEGAGQIAFAFGADSGSFTWDADKLNEIEKPYQTYDADGKPVAVVWRADGQTLTGHAGEDGEAVITVTATLTDTGASYKVISSGALVHPEPQGEGVTADTTALDLDLPFILTDGDGDEVPGSTTVSVADTVATMDELLAPDPTGEEGTQLLPGGTADGSFSVTPGKDGVDWSTFSVDGEGLNEDGVVTLDDGSSFAFEKKDDGSLTGKYTYTAGDAPGKPTYTFAVKDRDGDLASESVTITVDTPAPTAVWATLFGTVDESQLKADDDPRFIGTTVNEGNLTTTGTLTITSYDDLTELKFGEAITYSLSKNDSVLTATADGKTIFTATLDADKGTYAVEMFGSVDAPGGGEPIPLKGTSLGPVATIYLTSDGLFASAEKATGEKLATVTVIKGGNFSGNENGLAVGDNDFGTKEAMQFDFEELQKEIAFTLSVKPKDQESLKGKWTAYDDQGEEFEMLKMLLLTDSGGNG